MFSPELYRKVILPVDLWLRQMFKNFGIHHCGKFDRYAELYTTLTPDSLDVGGGSDYTILRRHFPTTQCTFIVNPEHFEGRSTAEIDRLVKGIATDGGPTEYIVNLHTYGVGAGATDDNIVDLRTSLKRQGIGCKPSP